MMDVSPCPYCKGNDVELTEADNEYLLLCYICGFSLKDSTKKELVEKWNEKYSATNQANRVR